MFCVLLINKYTLLASVQLILSTQQIFNDKIIRTMKNER